MTVVSSLVKMSQSNKQTSWVVAQSQPKVTTRMFKIKGRLPEGSINTSEQDAVMHKALRLQKLAN